MEHIVLDTPIVSVQCAEAFNGLSDAEKTYAYWLSKASNDGALICPLQTSVESGGIFDLLLKFFTFNDISIFGGDLKDVSTQNFDSFLMYCAGVLANYGNYKSFGDTKFLPALDVAIFESILEQGEQFSGLNDIWALIKKDVYEIDDSTRQLSYGNTTYLSPNCSEENAKKVQNFLDAKNISAYNTRLVKRSEDQYEILIAAVDEQFSGENHDNVNYSLKYGDYHSLLDHVNKGLEKAITFTSIEIEQQMITKYCESFQTGSIDAHKDASRLWVKNKGPTVEYYIGFIENYRDPFGSRGEFEGFVAVVNKERSLKYSVLVNTAPELLKLLPWGTEFEKARFLEPDFTSLDIVTYGGSSAPSGINIPNYDDVREHDGFKNLDLGNINSAIPKNVRIPFLSEEDANFLKDWKEKAWELQTALHELLGHGSGKLIFETTENWRQILNPVSGNCIDCCYKTGETYDGKFASLSSAYEECRAECVGLVLCTNEKVLEIFSYNSEHAYNVVYMNFLQFAYDGLRSLEFYDPMKKVWGQAHLQAAYAIMQVFMEADPNAVKIHTFARDGKLDIRVKLERKSVECCQQGVRKFLQKLQVYKATGDINRATEMFEFYSTPSEHMLSYRDVIIANKAPRKMLTLPNVFLDESNGKVWLKDDYPETPRGLIQSFVDRYKYREQVIDDMLSLWKQNRDLFS